MIVKSNRRFNSDTNDPVDVINQSKNIDFDQQDNNGNTILHYMCQRQSLELLRMLKDLIKAEELEIANKDGNIPLAIAMMNKYANLVKFIINRFDAD